MIGVIQTLLIKLFFKGEIEMMAIFFAQRVVLGKTAFSDVPEVLKPAVAENLLDSCLDFLVPKEYGGSAE